MRIECVFVRENERDREGEPEGEREIEEDVNERKTGDGNRNGE
jgi:hypothetical protein